MKLPPPVQQVLDEHPHRYLFVTVSGAHLYGFASPDSDYDLRASHTLPLEDVVGLKKAPLTLDHTEVRDGIEVDLVSHDVEKYLTMVLKRNGYVLEQIFSPLVVHTTAEHERLKEIASRCVTRHHGHHYIGFAHRQWQLFTKESPPRVKPLLYIYRVLLTGIHLLQTGEVQAHLPTLNEKFQLAFLDELIQRKREAHEKATMEDAAMSFHEAEFARLVEQLEEAGPRSHLRDQPEGRDDLHDLLLHLRLKAPN